MQNYFGAIGRAACDQNGWQVIATIQTHPGGDGFVPHGYVVVKRELSPLGEGLRFATAEWVGDLTSDPHISFGGGHYDLELQEAIADLVTRAGIRCIVTEADG